MTPTVDRWIGSLLLLLAIAAALLARGYRVNFIADPVGPRAFPLLAAALVAVGAGWIVLRPAMRDDWPPGPVRKRLGAAAAALALYPLALPLFGFLTATSALLGTIAALFRGRGVHAALTGILIAGVLYLLFVYALGVPLPIGRLFLRAA